MNIQQNTVSENNFEQCIKCTICTVYCPVAAVNPDYPGPKQAGPDGERLRLKRPDFFDSAPEILYELQALRGGLSVERTIGGHHPVGPYQIRPQTQHLAEKLRAGQYGSGGFACHAVCSRS